MCDKNKRDTDLLLDPLQLILHLFSQLQVKRRQRLIEQQYLRLIYQCACDRHSLLLAAGKQRRIFLFKSFQTDQLEHLHDLLVNDVFTHFFNFQSKSDIFIHIQMREKCIFLKNRVQLALIRRLFADLFPVKNYLSLVRIQESSKNPKKRRLAAAARSEQRHKFLLVDVQIDTL